MVPPRCFLVRRAAGNGVELIGILAFRASPVWVLAALADASGAGKYLIREISASLKEQSLLDRETEFSTVNEMLDGLEASAGRMAAAINAPRTILLTIMPRMLQRTPNKAHERFALYLPY